MRKSSGVENLALITQVGLMLITPILLCLFLGLWLDRKFKTGGILTVVLLLLGVAAAFRVILRLDKMKLGRKSEVDPDARLKETMQAHLIERELREQSQRQKKSEIEDEVEEW